jgi:predicted PhzF superfamily epimerase YddE/YHI9
MSSRYRFSQVDVFTRTPLRGNPLAVVHAADGLSEAQMQAFARWTNLSETTFLLQPTDPRADYRVRIFTPGGELPFAGHPTLGSCHAWLQAGGVPGRTEPTDATAGSDGPGRPGQPDEPGEVMQQCGVGLVRLRRVADRLAFEAPPLRRAAVEADLLTAVLRALGLDAAHVLGSQWLDNGPQWLALRLDSASRVRALEPDHQALKALPKVGVVAAQTEADADADADTDGPSDFEVRAFAASIGVAEDPVTGSLNAGLAQWLIAEGHAPTHYVAAQGRRLGRAGRVFIAQEAGTTWVGGQVVGCIEGGMIL